MSRTSQLAVLTVFSLVIHLAADHAASAQVVAYHHRSTVWGDHLAGASELVRAQGSFLRDEAAAAESWVRVAAAEDQLQYQRSEYRYQEKLMFLEYQKEKIAFRREREIAKENAEQAAALQLWKAAQRGGVAWPAALARPEYASSLSLVSSILRTWTPETAGDDLYRRALATEVAVLRTRVAENKRISHQARVEAVRTLERIQRITEVDAAEAIGGSGNSQIAMR